MPSVLQPSQVYFPSVIDTKERFDYKALKEAEDKINEADEDLNAVTKLLDTLVEYVNYCEKQYGYKPQIIITDHADNLNLRNCTFDTLVRERWRKNKDGLLDLRVIEASINTLQSDNMNKIV